MGRPPVSESRTDRNQIFSRQEVARELGVCRQTVSAYEQIAIFRVEHYRELMKQNGKIKPGKPLIPYQVWVLRKIKSLFDAFPSGSESTPWISEFLRKEPEILGYDAYLV